MAVRKLSRNNKRLEKNGISHEKYMELLYFCRQYGEKKNKLKEMTFAKAVDYTATGGRGGGSSTEKQALLREELKSEIELIEQTALETAPDIYKMLLKNVTEGVTYIYMDVPCGKEYFYKKRREFFYRLSLKR